MTIESIPIVDAHHHLWDLSLGAQEWLCRKPLPHFRYGDYASIRHDFLHADYARATAGQNVVASVTMEAEWDEHLLVDETRWTLRQYEIGRCIPAAHVARTFLHRPDAAEQLRAQAAIPLVRGIRHKPATAPAPDKIERGARAGMTDPDWRRGYAALAPNGLHFELQAPWWHVDELLDLISTYPETPVVINHSFLPADRSVEALAGWRQAIKRAATAPQVSMKISGIGLAGQPWRIEDNRPIILDLIEAFGVDRCMFASNFPVDGICGSFATIFDGYREATAHFSRRDRLNLFHDNAIRIYRLPIAPLAT